MKKRLVALILLFCTGFSLMACSNKSTRSNKYVKDKQNTDNKKKEHDKNFTDFALNGKAEKSTWTLDELNSSYVHRFSKTEDFWISYKGIKYNLPTSISLFQDWTSSELNEVVRPGQYLIGATLEKKGYEYVSVVPYNNTKEFLKVADCKIAGITVRQPLSASKTIEISLPRNISLGSSYNEVIKAYGDAMEEIVSKEYPDHRVLTYRLNLYAYVRIGFTKDLVTFFEIRNMN